MNARVCTLAGVFVALGVIYLFAFTDWLRPEPIQISSQIRASILQPRFGRGPIKISRTNAETGKLEVIIHTNAVGAVEKGRRARLPEWGEIGDAPGNVANVTFTLDAPYQLTALRVQDLPADGSPPRTMWSVTGQSVPTSSLLYGRMPKGMHLVKTNEPAIPLNAGAPYRLIVEAGRRRGTNNFTTRPMAGQ